MKSTNHCFECQGEKHHTEMHKSMSGPQICKKCHAAKRGYNHVAKVKSKERRFAERQKDRDAKARAVAEKEAGDLLSGKRPAAKNTGSKAWQEIEKFNYERELNKLVEGELY